MLFHRWLLFVWLAVVIHLSSSERDCKRKEGHENVLCHLGNVNDKLDEFAGTQQEKLAKILRNLDKSIDKIHEKGPIVAALVDMTRVVGSVIVLPYRYRTPRMMTELTSRNLAILAK